MKTRELMTKNVVTCSPDDSLERVAQLMWDEDCGAVPIVEDGMRLVGMITDRDACMAAYTRGEPFSAIRAREIMSTDLASVGPETSIAEAEACMRERQVRRVPVVSDGGRLEGILSINDLACAAGNGGRGRGRVSLEEVAETLAAICEHRDARELAAG